MEIIKIKSILLSLAAGIVLAVAPGTALANGHHDDNDNSNAHIKVTICHATGSTSHPFVMISPNANGVVSGHIGHQDANDIIPPFDYNDHGMTKHFAGQNWDVEGQAIFNNGCRTPEGGQGGGCDQENGRDQDCTPPQKDCDGDFDNSSTGECVTPQKDCDNDTDSSPATETECATTGGLGGGPTTTPTTTPQVLGSSTTGGAGAAQVAVVPQGSVNGGLGAASRTTNSASLVGLMVSLVSVGAGLSLLNRRSN